MRYTKINVNFLLIAIFMGGLLSISCKDANQKSTAETTVNPTEEPGLSEKNNAPQGGFEGIIHYEYNMGQTTYKGKYLIKGNRVRFEMENMNPMIFMPEKNKGIALMDGNKYMEMDYNALGKFQKDDKEKDEEIKINKTGKTKTIAGHECEVWEVEIVGKGTVSTLCMAEGLGSFMMKAGPMEQMMSPELAAEFLGKDYMPLESIMSWNGGTITMKAVKIEKKDLDDSLFEIPEGYTKVESPMQQLMNMEGR